VGEEAALKSNCEFDVRLAWVDGGGGVHERRLLAHLRRAGKLAARVTDNSVDAAAKAARVLRQ
jgi:hypothetical protein